MSRLGLAPRLSRAAFLAAAISWGGSVNADERPRIRDLGVIPGILQPGPHNAITDVAGVRVGHVTLVEGDSIRTGVTAILPHTGNIFHRKAPAAVYVGNGFGKAAGFLQVQELGNLESPIVLTNTLAVGTAVAAVVDWTLRQAGNEDVRSVNAVVGETNDGYLNDIRARSVRAVDVQRAIDTAVEGPVAEGCVGAGTGTRAFGWKGGIGTASRRLPESLHGATVGVLVQANFDGILTIDGRRVGEALGRYPFRNQLERSRSGEKSRDGARDRSGGGSSREDGSCMIVVATDAPLDAKSLERLARRAVLGLARTGSYLAHGSGDFIIAFSTRNLEPHAPGEPLRQMEILENDSVNPLFLAAVEAVEEAVYNALVRATTVSGYRGHTAEALPLERLRELLADR